MKPWPETCCAWTGNAAAAFERVLQLQNVPPLARRKGSSSRGDRPQRAGLRRVARSGRTTDQCGLSFLEQTSVCRSREGSERPGLFSPVSLVPSPSGAYLTGGLANLADLGKQFAPAGRSLARSAPGCRRSPAADSAAPGSASPVPARSCRRSRPTSSDRETGGGLRHGHGRPREICGQSDRQGFHHPGPAESADHYGL